ncbi:MAG TPA: deoxyribodipyrimidine photo-lyase [Candidatus Accumulibacter phosphatis]|nr:MAG: Deoxyribodipyrimidine photo-lyase [Candidatus Accumulibacter sp. SK-11]HAY27179.1 deoxyribodipyrimidine photo-lyase [Accumulibacter sp.]HRL75023.1 deoxyribodipyrimidine photo-lyase [Candidatus Accumulibacter phosphatis]HCN67031.1 deoxyribodipyrimidine photo-lyase [Accumulibacter sp.]HCV13392.1 deoxyribodipyrimidine photo-lyase [Accumulibacter sp.]
MESILVWFRRDLRDYDQAALCEALRRASRVHCAFVFDREIIDPLPRSGDRRVEFIRESLLELDRALRARGGALIVRHGCPRGEIPLLARQLGVRAVFANRDYEPQARQRDAAVAAALRAEGIGFELFKDQAVLDGEEVLTQAGRPYTVFTPYRNAWLKRLREDDWQAHCGHGGCLVASPMAVGVPALADLGFAETGLRALGIVPGMSGGRQRLQDFVGRLALYRQQRDFPAVKGVSYLSVHLRFGTVSVRELVALAIAAGALRPEAEGAATWLSELVWRDFYFMILDRFPHVVERSFRPEYDAIVWEQGAAAEQAFADWCAGRTGYPLVDAAMRQINASGYMHNRLRMLVASFLTKDLGLDWRWGEAFFARQLNDFDLAANNGGWQWAASTGCDAQPYFRIFNPVTQSERFDPGGRFIRRYLPELAAVSDRFIHAPWRMSSGEQAACGVRVGCETPPPLVDHDEARRRTLQRYAVVRRAAVP